jgi:hypothetical protein
LRRASKRFWLLVSVVVVVAVAALTMQGGWGAGGPKRVNELTLAGLQPGKDAFEKASKKLGKESNIRAQDDPNAHFWRINRDLDDLVIEADTNGIIRDVTVSFFPNRTDRAEVDCADRVYSRKFRTRWGSGRNLLLHDRCDRIEEIYGKPGSRSPSVRGSDKLELYLYKFDWAGPDVPQVMEVYCDASTQTLVGITLAASSL